MTTLEGCAGMAWAGVGSSSSSSEDEISPSVECSSLPSIGSISQSVLVSETASSLEHLYLRHRMPPAPRPRPLAGVASYLRDPRWRKCC